MVWTTVYVFVVVLTLTHRYNAVRGHRYITPPDAVFHDRLLGNQDGARTER